MVTPCLPWVTRVQRTCVSCDKQGNFCRKYIIYIDFCQVHYIAGENYGPKNKNGLSPDEIG